MPVIVFANPKGGAGKSTSALITGTTIAANNASVLIMDCDPNRPIQHWRSGDSKNPVEVTGDANESNITSLLDQHRTQKQFVIVDLEGIASRLTSRALSRANLVVIPIQASPNDAREAVKAIRLIQEEEQAFQKKIPYVIAFTRTNPAISRKLEKTIIEDLNKGSIASMDIHLNEREAFKAMFYHQLDLYEMKENEVNGLPNARMNAELFVKEMITIIQ